MPVVNCKVCEDEFHIPPSRVLPGGNTCSMKCTSVSNRVSSDKRDLIKKIWDDKGMKPYKIAKEVGVATETAYATLRRADKEGKLTRRYGK